MLKYAGEPTYISSRIVDQWDADIPAITVCPHVNGGIKEEVLQVTIFEKLAIKGTSITSVLNFRIMVFQVGAVTVS